MFNLGKMASNVLNSIDNAAKETLEEPKVSATLLRSKRRTGDTSNEVIADNSELTDTQSTVLYEGDVITPDSVMESEIPRPISVPGLLSVDEKQANQILRKDSDISSKGQKSTKDLTSKDPPLVELKKRLSAKDKEIERLNAECLELEDRCEAMKREVSEAWSTYKLAQEKSAGREQELLDEIRQLQKAKQADKQQSLLQFQKLGEDTEAALKQVKLLQQEKDHLSEQLRQALDSSGDWHHRETALLAEFEESRKSSQQTIRAVQDELRAAEFAMEELRGQHAQLMRHSHSRQTQLERDNAELTASISEKQREIFRLQRILQGDGEQGDNATVGSTIISREVDGLRQQLAQVTGQLDEERDRNNVVEKRARQLDCEYKAALILWEDERQRSGHVINEMTTEITDLKSKLKQVQNEETSKRFPGKLPSTPGTPVIGGENDGGSSALEQQVTNLGHQLLKKQHVVQDLQAEKAALKAKVFDLQKRCSNLEKQLQQHEDDDGDGNDVEEGGSGHYTTKSSDTDDILIDRENWRTDGAHPIRRRNQLNRNNGHSKMITEFEKIGVKPPAQVAKAVSMIDTWTLVTGRFLRSYPLLRLGFVFYLLGLHLWVLVILAIHMHSLDEGSRRSAILPSMKFVKSS